MNCITIDDELNALKLINGYIKKIDFLNLSGSFQNPIEAVMFCEKNNVDLIFLDINMPEINGLQVLKSLNKEPMVVFITAYSEYAAESFNFNVVDYLLKPIEFDRFLKAANKAYKLFLPSSSSITKKQESGTDDEYIFLRSKSVTYKTKINNILYIKGLGNYVQIITVEKTITSYSSLQQILESLPKNTFCRIHKTYIINLKHISQYENHRVMIDKTYIPIGATYRQKFNDRINS
jgi:two-component system, LytTR family, response regulator